jgi:hypothetical protein
MGRAAAQPARFRRSAVYLPDRALPSPRVRVIFPLPDSVPAYDPTVAIRPSWYRKLADPLMTLPPLEAKLRT